MAQRGCGGPQVRERMGFDPRNPNKSAARMNFQRLCPYSAERIPAGSSQGYSESGSSAPSLFCRAGGTLGWQQHLPAMTLQPVTEQPSPRRGTGITGDLRALLPTLQHKAPPQQPRGCCKPEGKSSCQPSPSREHLSLHPRLLTPAGRRKNTGFRKKK